MKLNRVLSFLLLFPIMATAWAANDYTQYVNPWIGTGSKRFFDFFFQACPAPVRGVLPSFC